MLLWIAIISCALVIPIWLFKPGKRLLLKLAMGCALAFACVALMWKLWESNHFRNALPPELETTGLAITGSDTTLLSALIPFRLEACGGAIFRMTDEVREAIKTKGLAFFANALHGRGYMPSDRLYYYYTYKPWREAPVPWQWTGEGIWSGLNCMNLDRKMVAAIRSAALGPGAYYSIKDEAKLLVIPDLGLIVFTYYG